MCHMTTAGKFILFWAALLLLAASLATVGFSSSQWLTKDLASNPKTLDVVDRIECGVSVYCIHGGPAGNAIAGFEVGSFCATRYGGSFKYIPSAQWRIATGLAIVAIILLWACSLLALVTLCCCWRSKIRRLRNVAPMAAFMSATAIGFAANGFGDFTPPGDAGAAPKICQMCDGAGSFKAGDCKVGFGLYMAVAGTVVALVASGIGYYVPTHDNRVRPVGATSTLTASGRHQHMHHSNPNVAIHTSGLCSPLGNGEKKKREKGTS